MEDAASGHTRAGRSPLMTKDAPTAAGAA
jgi:hypothetical protein